MYTVYYCTLEICNIVYSCTCTCSVNKAEIVKVQLQDVGKSRVDEDINSRKSFLINNGLGIDHGHDTLIFDLPVKKYSNALLERFDVACTSKY